MNDFKLNFFFSIFAVVLIQGCQSKSTSGLVDKPFGEAVGRDIPSLEQDDPQVLAQKLFEADKGSVKKVGPLVLRNWMKNGSPVVLDVTKLNIRKKWGKIKNFHPWNGKDALKVGLDKTIVLVGSKSEVGKLIEIESLLKRSGFRDLNWALKERPK